MIHVNGLWSVAVLNLQPYQYGLTRPVVLIIARNTFSLFLYPLPAVFSLPTCLLAAHYLHSKQNLPPVNILTITPPNTHTQPVSTCSIPISSCPNPVALFSYSLAIRRQSKRYLNCFWKTNFLSTDLELTWTHSDCNSCRYSPHYRRIYIVYKFASCHL